MKERVGNQSLMTVDEMTLLSKRPEYTMRVQKKHFKKLDPKKGKKN